VPRRAEDRGLVNATKPAEVRKILSMVRATKNDIFYDFGCGDGGVCIEAAKKVKLAIGLEDHYHTYLSALKNVRNSNCSYKIRIRNSEIQNARFGNGTIVYTTLDEDGNDLERFERILKDGCRFVTIYLPLIGIKPNRIEYPFYVMKVPFKHAKTEQEWTRSILRTKNATPLKLYKKLRHRYGGVYVKKVRRILAIHLKKTKI